MDICRRRFNSWMVGGLAARALSAPSGSKLLVLVLLEQFRADYLDAAAPFLGPGGFRRLLEKGAYFPDCRHSASTFSASTVATLATGAWPAQHGIVADSWFDPASKKPVPAADESLLATTLAAQVVAQTGGRDSARAFVLADSARQAALFAGTPDARLLWMDAPGQFTTRGTAPQWLDAYNTRNPPEALYNAKWLASGARPAAPPLRVLTYDQNHPGNFAALYRASPFAQSAAFDLFDECLRQEQLGQSGSFDFVCIVSSAMSMLGYETGAQSPLMQQMVLSLDRRLEALFATLTKVAGENGFTLAVAGAHGAPPQPSPAARPRMAVAGESVAQHIARALSANSFGAVRKYLYPFLYLDTDGWMDPEPVRLAAGRAALNHPAVANFYTARGDCSAAGQWRTHFQNSFHAQRSGDVMLSYRPEYVEDFGESRGISYGSLYNYDTRVPLCFFGPQFRPGIYELPVESIDLAPTLARAMGVAAPSSSMGRVLAEGLLE